MKFSGEIIFVRLFMLITAAILVGALSLYIWSMINYTLWTAVGSLFVVIYCVIEDKVRSAFLKKHNHQ